MFEEFTPGHIIPLLEGACVTVVICLASIVIGTAIGLVVGMILTTNNKELRMAARIYVNALRGVPLLIILFMIYYAVPLLLPGTHVSREFASVAGLSIYAGAYIAELVRGAIQSIPKGQTEAAEALGMTTVQRMGLIIMPQAARLLLPPLVGFIIALIKDSSLISVIGYIDLTRSGKIIGNLTMNPLLAFAFVALIYFVICYSLSRFAAYLEIRLRAAHERNAA